ncbi:isoprenylcysteine carboxylmethyltransferase family protein [Deferribacter autotrophicus]|uniref:Isoprenylcysteine carboxylmethyltransferase family protein n=1 Tax=Deferribacter autotrophicus TaxID=500465 RepID=A0A5A8F0N9_9BACT|nr:isoprenylcysteine carboxylmethyltransferase family protein [Deferribacter autotrophicus]KAA0257428.1 isoprenylcysteine carboxylmethyltransferase family protein [Deferribacter autotrophicus]
MTYYYILATYLIFYCILHSIMADDVIMNKIYYKWWYRGFFVIISTVLLVPAVIIYSKIKSEYFFNPPLAIKIILYLINIAALLFGYYASKCYDNDEFLGIKQIREYFKKGVTEVNHHKKLIVKGALKYVRHPYYFAGIVLLWSRPLKVKDLLVNIIFTLYLILGAINEERKLIKYYGEEYINYKKEVPMLIPRFFRFRE